MRPGGRSGWGGALAAFLATVSPLFAQPIPADPSFPTQDAAFLALVAPDPDATGLALPRGRGAANVCAASDWLMGFYPGQGISSVTLDGPFMPSQRSAICHVRIVTAPAPGRPLFASPTCRMIAVAADRVEIVIPPASMDRFAASECFYRLALVLEGYSGALTAPVFGRYPDSAYFITKRRWVGPIVTPWPTTLSLRCRDLESGYFTADFAQRVRNCLATTPPIRFGPRHPADRA